MVRGAFGEGLLSSTIFDMSRTGKRIVWSGEGLGKGFSPQLSLIHVCQEQVKELLHGQGRIWGRASPLNYH